MKTIQTVASLFGLLSIDSLLVHFVVSGAGFLASGSKRPAGRHRFVAKALNLDVPQRYVAALINDRPENRV
jgi:hypothetical protein